MAGHKKRPLMKQTHSLGGKKEFVAICIFDCAIACLLQSARSELESCLSYVNWLNMYAVVKFDSVWAPFCLNIILNMWRSTTINQQFNILNNRKILSLPLILKSVQHQIWIWNFKWWAKKKTDAYCLLLALCCLQWFSSHHSISRICDVLHFNSFDEE